MTRRISVTIRLLGATLALAAGIVGFSSAASAPATVPGGHLAVATSFSAVAR